MKPGNAKAAGKIALFAAANLFCCAALVILPAPSGHAGPVFDSPITWDDGSLSGWTNAAPIGTEDATVSNPGNNLQIRFAQQVGLPAYQEDTIYTTNLNAVGNFQGTNGATVRLTFTFTADDTIPMSSVLYLHPDGEPNANVWQYEFVNDAVGPGQIHTIDFSYSANWTWSAGAGDATQFWNDLAAIDWIGINIARAMDTTEQDYRLDDWEYSSVIPEPGSMAVLASAAAGICIALRKRRKAILNS